MFYATYYFYFDFLKKLFQKGADLLSKKINLPLFHKFLFGSDTEGNIFRAVHVTPGNEPVITFRDSEVM